jgi:tetratricopeptide (TPR) repeat protein
VAWYLLAQCYRMKDAYPQAVEAGRKAIQINPSNGEAHFWLAEGLRMSGDYAGAVTQYTEYLRLSDYDSKLAGQLNYYVLGYLEEHGIGSVAVARHHNLVARLGFFECSDQHHEGVGAACVAHCGEHLLLDLLLVELQCLR